MRDSSAMEWPSMTLPSTGNFPPGTTLTTSPLCTRSTSSCSSLQQTDGKHYQHRKFRLKPAERQYLRIELSLPRVTTVASVACRDISLDRASDVLLYIECRHAVISNGDLNSYWHFKLLQTLAICSSQRPKEIKTKSIGGVSKKVMGFTVAVSAMATMRTITE